MDKQMMKMLSINKSKVVNLKWIKKFHKNEIKQKEKQ